MNNSSIFSNTFVIAAVVFIILFIIFLILWFVVDSAIVLVLAVLFLLIGLGLLIFVFFVPSTGTSGSPGVTGTINYGTPLRIFNFNDNNFLSPCGSAISSNSNAATIRSNASYLANNGDVLALRQWTVINSTNSSSNLPIKYGDTVVIRCLADPNHTMTVPIFQTPLQPANAIVNHINHPTYLPVIVGPSNTTDASGNINWIIKKDSSNTNPTDIVAYGDVINIINTVTSPALPEANTLSLSIGNSGGQGATECGSPS